MDAYSPNAVRKVQGQHIKDNIGVGAIVKGHVKGESWATIQGKIIAQAPYASTDVSVTDSGDDVVITFNPKSDVDQSDTAAANEDIVFLALDTTNNLVLHCADLTDRLITNEAADRCSWPAITHTIKDATSQA